ncbi:MAG: hypothetical protein ACK5JU_04965 [Bacteroidales bacterium]
MDARKENLIKRIENVQRIVEENYEPGNQNKCKLQAFRRHVMDIYPMSERTFWRYVNADIDKETSKKEDARQLKLEF